MIEERAWLLDLYSDPQDDLVLWMLAESGQRLRLRQPFPVTFYIAGPPAGLRQARRELESQPVAVKLAETQRRDLFAGQDIPVLAVTVRRTDAQAGLFNRLSRLLPDLTYYDADIPISLRYAALHGTFALAHCRIRATEDGSLKELKTLNSAWELDPAMPPLRILSLEPDVNPSHAAPASLEVRWAGKVSRLALKPVRALLANLNAILQDYDPDLLLTSWGDTWMLAELYDLAHKAGLPLALNRDASRGLLRRKERSYQAYGQVIHRGKQIHLFGRLHIDRCNAMMWGDYGLEGVLELSRVTSLPMQVSARVSPGTGISSMQILTALRDGTLVPWNKQQSEDLRPARDLFYADQGGLVYQPRVGLHFNVAEIDFISMYPSVMLHFNISPETLGPHRPGAVPVPELGLAIDNSQLGLVPRTLKPLLEKRVALKTQLLLLPKWDPRRKHYQASAQAHKWLLVTCFGYLGYKNARFGRIEAHQAVTAYGREALLRAKEAAEDAGFDVLHLYVDGMWAVKPGAHRVEDFQPLLESITDRTGLPISLDGIFRWVAFLPSRRDERVPVANRYFGVFQDGEVKVRGVELRRLDTPPFISRMQADMLSILAKQDTPAGLYACLPALMDRLQRSLDDVRLVRLPLADYLVTLRVSRPLEEFRTPSPTARALAQLRQVGKELRPGQRVRFLFLRGEPRVWAWDLPTQPDPAALDTQRYRTLLLRAAGTILQPFGVPEESLREWAVGQAVTMPLPGRALQLALR